jgi:hypothetical protein
MKIIQIDKSPDKVFKGWVDEGSFYQQFKMDGSTLTMRATVPKDIYKDYEHFAAVMGKFNPYISFLKKPIKIDGLTLKEVKRAYKEFKSL